VIVAIPRGLPCHKILDLACLVLSGPEYAQLRERIEPAPARPGDRGYRGAPPADVPLADVPLTDLPPERPG